MSRFITRYRHDQAGHRHLLSRTAAFLGQGATLADPLLSRSALRDDGTVVLAMPQVCVREDDHGFSCRLWTPSGGEELLGHCRRAVLQGGADALLERPDGMVKGNAVIAVRVQRIGNDYWALWGSSVRAMGRDHFELPRAVSAHAKSTSGRRPATSEAMA